MGLLEALRDPQFRSDLGTNARQLGQSASNTIAEGVTMPVDALAWLLRRGRVNVPQNPVGGSEWAKQQGLMADVPQGAPKTAGEALGLLAPLAGTKQSVNALATALRQGGENLSKARTMNPQTGAIVWHGSPHKFDKFDASKIGTGEGAQAYGHGLYLAESPDVATRYRDTLTNFRPDHIEAKLVEAGISPEFANTYSQFAAQTKGGARGLDDFAELMRKPGPSPYIEQFRQRIRSELPAAQKASDAIAGSLYKVDLPDDQIARMLDWDKPLSAQPQIIDAIRKNATLGENSSGWKGAPSGMFDRQFNNAERNGEYLYRDMLSNTPQAADELRRMGIPGIRYLDGGSRGAGQGSSNFVVFPGNENMLRILERNGQGLLK